MTFEQYFTDSQHRFMNACYYILIACGWDDDEAYFESKEALDDWENSLHDDLDAMKKEQSIITADWLLCHKSENPIDQREASRFATKSNVLSSDIRYLEGIIENEVSK